MQINADDYSELYSEPGDNELRHYGIKRKSGRYPWGSGRTPEERSASFLGMIDEMRKSGMKDSEIAKAFSTEDEPFNTTHLRATISIANNAKKAADIARAEYLKNTKQMSNTAAAKLMGIPESTFRGLLAPGVKDRADILTATSDMLRNRVDEHGFVDIGKGNEAWLGLAPTKFNTAVRMLESEGYTVHNVQIKQLGTGKDTTTKVIAPPGTKWQDIQNHTEKIVGLQDYTADGGRHWDEIQPPISVSSKRLEVVYGKEGGEKSDGVIYVRPGAEGLDMGGAKYAQARIMVDGTHYLKGMAVQKDGLPEGVDIQFHTNKERGTPVLGPKGNTILKPVQRTSDGKVDEENPFGSALRRQILDEHGRVKSAINIVNEDATWDDWSRNLASQMLSKQSRDLVRRQLDLTYARKADQLAEIMSLTNPTVRERLLQSYSDDMDSSAVHLKAAALPRQKTHVILPINSLKENEVYAPGYRDGESLVLIRYPHGGKFEIPELTVNNRNAEGKRNIGPESTTAVGINHKVAARLSGADFDGDTVVVIPNNHRLVSTESPLHELKNFDPQSAYPGYPGMKIMNDTQTQMGLISNLITDMTIQGATHSELARAVKHSMVVIDAEKHGLNYKQSAIDNNITQLREKYQKSKRGGASTLISKTTHKVDVPDFKDNPASNTKIIDGREVKGKIDPVTGRKVTVETGKMYNKPVKNKETGEITWVPTPSIKKVPLGSLYDDAHELIDPVKGTEVERLYADYSNKVKALANTARKELLATKPIPVSPSAKKVYAKEVASLNEKLIEAKKNAPLERQAQTLANAAVKAKRQANPDMDQEQIKKAQSQALRTYRARTGAEKQRVEITPREWEAIQSGAITHTKLKEILANADIEKIKQLATPRTSITMTASKIGRARALANSGYTMQEIADELGVSVSTLKRGLSGK